MRTVDKIALAHLPGIIAGIAVVLAWATGAPEGTQAVLGIVLRVALAAGFTWLSLAIVRANNVASYE